MTKADGKPCKRCGTNEWDNHWSCKECSRNRIKKWNEENKERRKLKSSEWSKNNRDKKNKSWQKWKQNNAETIRENSRRWRQNNPEKKAIQAHRYRARKTGAGGSYTAHEWKALCSQYDNRCLCCGKKGKLTADHIVPVIMGGTSDISNIQPLCGPCNSIKGDRHTTDYRTKSGIKRWIQKKLFD